MHVNKTIFREYDLRGLANTELTADFAFGLGQAFVVYLEKNGFVKKVLVGADNRATSPLFSERLMAGLRESGADVTFLGEVPTPTFYFASRTLSFPAGIMVTASHNPPAYNGFKLLVNYQSIFGPQIQEIRELMEAGKFRSGNGGFKQLQVVPDYLAAIKKAFQLDRSIKVVLDCGNGTAGPVALPALIGLGAEVIPLYCNSDNTFPHHLADPVVPKNMADLVKKVKESGAELGIGIDGDGDRIGLCDEEGNLVWGDKILALLSEEVISENPGATIVFDVKCSKTLEEEITRLGGKPLMWKTGHSLIEDKMHEVGAKVAGELSGHLYFGDHWYGFDDAIYASGRVLQYLSRHREKLSSLLGRLKQYYATPEIRLEIADEEKFGLVERLKEKVSGKYKISDIDGVKVYFEDGWGLVRASNTQPALVLRFEADTEKRLHEIQSFFTELLASLK
ncbi:MAG: phosphomannomutase/phosphoglucomutase [Candidatus Omnitrophota bacterium]|nr:phosphomannomutase/phosphoglucomutase [Candidatus Omnitrophota bacterium]